MPLHNSITVAVLALAISCSGAAAQSTCLLGPTNLGRTEVVASSGFLAADDIVVAGTEIIPSTLEQQQVFNYISQGKDSTGKYTEALLFDFAFWSSCRYYRGPKYGSDNGIDLLLDSREDNQTVIVYEAKQWTDSWFHSSDGVQLSRTTAGYQLSDPWIQNVADQSAEASTPLLRDAIRLRMVRKAGGAVERDCGMFTCARPAFWIYRAVVD